MSADYTLPEGMTAERLRELADDMKTIGGWATDADTVEAWADAIDPPEPVSVVTDEMVRTYAVERNGFEDVGSLLAIGRTDLEAVERLGWLRTESETLVDWERLYGDTVDERDELDGEYRRLAAENNDLRKRLHDLESDADNPSPSDEPWPTGEQVEAAAKASYAILCGEPWGLAPNQWWWIERARATLEAVAPPPADFLHEALMAELRDRGADPDLTWDEAIGIMAERLEMAEGLLRRTELEDDEWGTFGVFRPVTPDEADYLRSLTGEGE